MRGVISNTPFPSFVWTDVSDPSEAEINSLKETYSLHQDAILDIFQPEHLPKYEHTDETQFMIIRYYDEGSAKAADSIREMSRKISVFCNEKYLLTIHRGAFRFPAEAIAKAASGGVSAALYLVLKSALHSFEEPLSKLDKDIEFYESRIFLKKRIPDLLKSLYLIKRRVYVIRKLINLSKEVVDKVTPANRKSPAYQDLRDYYTKVDTAAEELYDSINSLLTIYISLSSQRTNEVMRVIAVFSAFFLPLTFLVGVYGMNFKFMPELDMPMAYPVVWGVMVTCTLIIYSWFKRRGWM